MRQKDTPNRHFENPENGCIVPRVGAVRLPKPGADLAWSAPGWDFPPSARRSRPGGWNSSSVKVESRPTERTLWERSVMSNPVLTKASAIESIKCCVSLQKERFAFTLLRLTRRIVLSNQEGGRKRAPSGLNIRIRAMGSLNLPPEYRLAPCAGAVSLPKPVADLAGSAAGWRL